MTFATVPMSGHKEIFTCRSLDNEWVGCVRSQESITITPKTYPTALKAANAARTLKKHMKMQTALPTLYPETAKAKKKKTFTKSDLLLRYKGKFYTQEETDSLSSLNNFMEVWVITKDGGFVSDCLDSDKKVLYKTKTLIKQAKLFRDHEEAKRVMKVLRNVAGPGFDLRRFSIKSEG